MKKINVKLDDKIAEEGEVIAYYYYGLPAYGTVRKILTNSVIVSVEGVNKNSIKQRVNAETVIAHKNYGILNKNHKMKRVSQAS